MKQAPQRLTMRTGALLAAGAVLLAACSPRGTLVGAGGAVASGVSAVGSAAGAAVSDVGFAVADAVSGGSQAADEPGADATAQSAEAQPDEIAQDDAGGAAGTATLAAVAVGGAAASAAAGSGTTAAQVTPSQALRDGIGGCIDTFGGDDAAATLLATGWVYARETENAAEIDEQERLRAIRKSGVRGNVLPGQRCTFRTRNVAGPMGRAIAIETVEDRVGAGISEGSPYGREGPCEGVTFDIAGQRAWMYFTAANGGVCTGQGTGVTIRLI